MSTADSNLVDRLEEVSARVRAAEAALAKLQQERHEVWREALDAGMSAYRIAAVCAVTQRAVHKVREVP